MLHLSHSQVKGLLGHLLKVLKDYTETEGLFGHFVKDKKKGVYIFKI